MEKVLTKVHNWVYPPDSKYYWYRDGKVSRMTLFTKYWKFLLFSLFLGLAGSPQVILGFMIALTVSMKEWHNFKHGLPMEISQVFTSSNFSSATYFSNMTQVSERALHKDVDPFIQETVADPYWAVLWCMLAGTSTLIVYTLGAQYLEREFYEKKKDQVTEWKCQPNRFSSPALLSREKKLGCFNSFVSGSFGCFLFFIHQNVYPFMKLHYSLDDGFLGVKGFAGYALGTIYVFLWVEFYSYWIHRILHNKRLYKHVHKVHHTWKAPTAWGAFAIHPVEFLMFQSAGIWACVVLPVHLFSFLSVVIFIAYENQVSHSGISFDNFGFFATVDFHDQHHELFHVNYGVTLVCFDWFFDTLRKGNRKYAEDIFEGEQDQVTEPKKVK